MDDCLTRPLEPRPLTYLGFDYGDKKTGVAVGQRFTGTASSLETLSSQNREAFWQSVARLVRTWQPSAFVVGIPRPIVETVERNPFIDRVLAFCRELEARHGRPVHLMDEALSTRESRTLFYHHRTRKSLRFADVKDELAAQIILQNWLDHTTPTERLDG